MKMRVLLPCWPCYALRDASKSSKWKKSQSFYIQRRQEEIGQVGQVGPEMSDKFQALLTQLKAGAMVPHWTSIGKHTNRVWLQRLENQVFQSSRSPWSFFVSKTVALSQNCWQQAWGCLWSSHACTLFSEPKKDNKPWDLLQRRACRPKPHFHLLDCICRLCSFCILFAQTKRFLARNHSIAAPSHV